MASRPAVLALAVLVQASSRGEVSRAHTQELVGVDDEYVIEPVVRPGVLAGYDGEAYPVLRREPLYQAKNNQSVGSATR